MPRRVTRRRRLKKYGVGDMRERITIHTRVITPPTFNSSQFSETYDAGIDEWASVETPNNGVSSFSGVNVPEGATHIFVVRFDSSFSTENIVRWEGDAYKILKTNDPDKRQQYLEFFSKLLGDETLDANT